MYMFECMGVEDSNYMYTVSRPIHRGGVVEFVFTPLPGSAVHKIIARGSIEGQKYSFLKLCHSSSIVRAYNMTICPVCHLF